MTNYDGLQSSIKQLVFIALQLSWLISSAQTCPTISYPTNGALDIPVDATITWPAVQGINGYVLSIGTASGGTEVLDSEPIGIDNFYTPPLGLPENTPLYLSLSLIPFDQPPIKCEEITFTTVDVISPPPCTILLAPDNNAANVTIITEIVWAYAPTATGYNLSMGTAPGGRDLVDKLDMGNVLRYDPPEDLPQDTEIFVTIIPSNENGSMGSCTEESFITGASPYICDPIIDEVTGETIYRKPQIEFPSLVGICSDELPYTINTNDSADGFRWFRTNSGSAETLLSETNSVGITEPGRYRYEAYNFVDGANGVIECSSSKLFNVVASEIAVIEEIEVINLLDGKMITITVSGNGDYEFALDEENGPYQDSTIFESVPAGQHIAFVRDKNGCGTVKRSVDRDLTTDDFPRFFSPNGDGINDFWQFMPPPQNFEEILKVISIFDRYGNFLTQINPNQNGWDGNFNGRPLPASDYWFKAIFLNRQEIRGHFSLMR